MGCEICGYDTCGHGLLGEAPAYGRANDKSVSEWVRDRCEVGSGKLTPFRVLYADYAAGISAKGLVPASGKLVSQTLCRMGFAKVRTSSGRKVGGLALRS